MVVWALTIPKVRIQKYVKHDIPPGITNWNEKTPDHHGRGLEVDHLLKAIAKRNTESLRYQIDHYLKSMCGVTEIKKSGSTCCKKIEIFDLNINCFHLINLLSAIVGKIHGAELNTRPRMSGKLFTFIGDLAFRADWS